LRGHLQSLPAFALFVGLRWRSRAQPDDEHIG
jgi:hypothetical protein